MSNDRKFKGLIDTLHQQRLNPFNPETHQSPQHAKWTGRILREDKKGAIPADTPEILSRLNIDSKHWVYLTKDFESPFKTLVGCA